MFLKRIDVTGFKSFADHTEIAFAPGITAVVGPNGSGKSNIADAIRWVLGEQSARTLRGAKMEDVIFAGTETRRPINYCEVSLTLDNADEHLGVVYEEVTVTRRMYRSGESEYMMNKQPCRLKDIAELFMDSGMGRESYSIIGQGKIEEMLSTRPEDRRGPFEDAAGIVKFKFRKREAERRLAETDANITRVDDILDELERQAGPLEADANRAKEYRTLLEEHQALDIGLLVYDIEDKTMRFRDAKDAVEQARTQRQAARTGLSQMQEKLASQRTALEDRRQTSELLQSQHIDLVERRQRLQGEQALHAERSENAARQIEDKQGQLSGLTEELTDLESTRERLQTRQQELSTQASGKQSELQRATDAVDPAVKARLEAEIARLNEEYIELHHESAGFRNEMKMAEEYLAQDKVKQERFDAQRERLQSESDEVAAEQSVKQEQLEQAERALQTWTEKSQECATKGQSLAGEEAQTVSAIHRVESETASLVSRLELLTELENGYDGYALGAKTVLQAAARNRLKGIHGPVAGLIQVAKDYEVAVETALGGALQNIVVETEAAGREAIDLLKQRHAGRATFLPLSVIKSRLLAQSDQAQLEGQTGFVGMASQLVTVDDAYRNVIEHLVGNVVVTDNLVHANEMAKRLHYRTRVVSLEGDVVSPGGAMTGGAMTRKGPGLLGRSRERQEVQQRIAKKRSEVESLREQQQALRTSLGKVQEQQRTCISEIDRTRQELETIKGQMKDILNRRDSILDKLESVEWEISELAQGHSGWNGRLARAREQLDEVLQTIDRTEQQLATTRRSLAERETSLSTAQDALTAIQVELATVAQAQQTVTEQVNDCNLRVSRLSQRSTQLKQEISDLAATKERELFSRAEAQTKLTEVEALVSDMEGEGLRLRQEVQEMEGSVAEQERMTSRAQEEVTASDERLYRMEVNHERIDADLQNSLKRMNEAHKMTFEWARDHHRLSLSVTDAKQRADKLGRRMAEMGEVHLGAIEEWERLSERLRFLTRERNDLRQAQEELESVISEMDEEMSKRFAHTFEAIRQEFRISFRQLFGGGKADLTLTEPDNLLQTGIEVIAQPPGKKLQNLNLLSGGERALAAMALLFAILRVRPVPFCLLDEVEAALDEANVSRFANQLRAFADETQFIVVTHRRGTMEEADVLYGVTMQESGVSALIGVRLEEAQIETDSETA